MALCYNFTRVLNILGLDRFLACLASNANAARRGFPAVRVLALRSFLLELRGFCMTLAMPLEVTPHRATPAP
jgi:hypothetical protein